MPQSRTEATGESQATDMYYASEPRCSRCGEEHAQALVLNTAFVCEPCRLEIATQQKRVAARRQALVALVLAPLPLVIPLFSGNLEYLRLASGLALIVHALFRFKQRRRDGIAASPLWLTIISGTLGLWHFGAATLAMVLDAILKC